MEPKTKTIAHNIIPVAEKLLFPSFEAVEIILIINPINASGRTNQFNHPKQGINAINIPINDNIPMNKLAICILVLFCV